MTKFQNINEELVQRISDDNPKEIKFEPSSSTEVIDNVNIDNLKDSKIIDPEEKSVLHTNNGEDKRKKYINKDIKNISDSDEKEPIQHLDQAEFIKDNAILKIKEESTEETNEGKSTLEINVTNNYKRPKEIPGIKRYNSDISNNKGMKTGYSTEENSSNPSTVKSNEDYLLKKQKSEPLMPSSFNKSTKRQRDTDSDNEEEEKGYIDSLSSSLNDVSTNNKSSSDTSPYNSIIADQDHILELKNNEDIIAEANTLLQESAEDISKPNHQSKSDLDAFKRKVLAIQRIVASRQYRCVADSLERYFRERWDMSRAQVYRFIDCAEVFTYLEGIEPQPSKERLCRSLKRVAKTRDEMRMLWTAALDSVNKQANLLSARIIEATWEALASANLVSPNPGSSISPSIIAAVENLKKTRDSPNEEIQESDNYNRSNQNEMYNRPNYSQKHGPSSIECSSNPYMSHSRYDFPYSSMRQRPPRWDYSNPYYSPNEPSNNPISLDSESCDPSPNLGRRYSIRDNSDSTINFIPNDNHIPDYLKTPQSSSVSPAIADYSPRSYPRGPEHSNPQSPSFGSSKYHRTDYSSRRPSYASPFLHQKSHDSNTGNDNYDDISRPPLPVHYSPNMQIRASHNLRYDNSGANIERQQNWRPINYDPYINGPRYNNYDKQPPYPSYRDWKDSPISMPSDSKGNIRILEYPSSDGKYSSRGDNPSPAQTNNIGRNEQNGDHRYRYQR